MKPSQRALLSIAGILAGIVVVTAVAGRVALSRSDSAILEGDLVSESRELSGFNEVEVAGALHVNLVRGDEWKVERSHADGMEKRLRIRVLGNRLRVAGGSFPGSGSGSPVSVDIVMPELEAVELRGGSNVALSGFGGERLEIDVAGAVRLTGRDGRYEELELSAAGASAIDLRGIAVTDAAVDLEGASDVVLTMSGGVLSGSAAGAGSLRYYGTVSEERVEVAGITRIVHDRD